jgi:hypothetical protein
MTLSFRLVQVNVSWGIQSNEIHLTSHYHPKGAQRRDNWTTLGGIWTL